MERTPSAGHLFVGAMHSEAEYSLQAVFHQKHGIPHARASKECVALFEGSHLPEGEAFPAFAPHC